MTKSQAPTFNASTFNTVFILFINKVEKNYLAHFLPDLEKQQSHRFDLVECNLRKKWMAVGICFDLKKAIWRLGESFQFLHNFTNGKHYLTAMQSTKNFETKQTTSLNYLHQHMYSLVCGLYPKYFNFAPKYWHVKYGPF